MARIKQFKPTKRNINQLIKLYKSGDFSGSFTGLSTFQRELFTSKRIKISKKELWKVLQKIPSYLQMRRPRFHFKRKSYDQIEGFSRLWHADLAQMPKSGQFKYFLLAIDVYTRFIWTVLLKNKKAVSVKSAFQTIFK